jgi:hypothetical protein
MFDRSAPAHPQRAIDDTGATTIRMRAETSRRCFEDMLAFFVQKYAPEHPYDRDTFQRDLMMLMRDAMEHKSNVFDVGISEMVAQQLAMAATAPLQAREMFGEFARGA